MKHAFDRFIHYLQKNYFSYWVVLGIDTFIALLCTWVSFIGIHYITETSKEIVSLFHILAVSVISSVLGATLFHTYRNTIRFSQLKAVSYTHLRAHETGRNLVCRLLLEKKKKKT